jgi:hypothetical protein
MNDNEIEIADVSSFLTEQFNPNNPNSMLGAAFNIGSATRSCLK